jgi:hypothetical protein
VAVAGRARAVVADSRARPPLTTNAAHPSSTSDVLPAVGSSFTNYRRAEKASQLLLGDVDRLFSSSISLSTAGAVRIERPGGLGCQVLQIRIERERFVSTTFIASLKSIFAWFGFLCLHFEVVDLVVDLGTSFCAFT